MNCVSVFLPRIIRCFLLLRYYYGRMFISLLISLLAAGCGAPKISQYRANDFNSYSNQLEKSDLHVAVQPMTNEEEQEKYFGVVLTESGVLPIYVIAENRNPSHRFMLRDDHILLRNEITKNYFPKPLLTDAADDSHLEGAKKSSLIAGNVALLATAGLASAPLLFTSLSLARNSEKVKIIQDNMFDKTFFTQIILPSKTAGGFAYFKISDTKIDLSNLNGEMKNLALIIQVTDESEESTCDFQFDLP